MAYDKKTMIHIITHTHTYAYHFIEFTVMFSIESLFKPHDQQPERKLNKIFLSNTIKFSLNAKLL